MTIPASPTWCPDCDEACLDHPTMCTVCGATLVVVSSRSNSTTRTPSIRPISDDDPSAIQLTSTLNDARNWLSSLNTRMETIRDEAQALRQQLVEIHELQQQAAAAALVQNQSLLEVSTKKAKSSVVDNMPRIQNSIDCKLFQQCVLEFIVTTTSSEDTNSSNKVNETATCNTDLANNKSKTYTISAIPGDFCKWPITTTLGAPEQQQRYHMSNMSFVLADAPGTGEGDGLSLNTMQTIQQLVQKQRSRVILYMNRGGGISFVQKAVMAQSAGASICIIGNHLPDGPWPYTMTDSTNEVIRLKLTIPVIMVSYTDGQFLQQLYLDQNNTNSIVQNQPNISCSITVQPKDYMLECCICTEAYGTTDCTILQILPGCGHFFHESCALQWLHQHNTCPYCRFVLPLDDDDLERDRLQRERQQQETLTNTYASDEYYG